MKSYLLRKVVRHVKEIIDSNDLNCKCSQTQLSVSEVAKLLNLQFWNNERTVTSAVLYMKNKGVKLENVDCWHTRRLIAQTRIVIDKCSDVEIDNLLTISECLFNQKLRDC
jgi:hypothetical protein